MSDIDISAFPLIYIITRTSQRPKYFHQMICSVLNQTYPRIRHLVSYDDRETGEYLKKYTRIMKQAESETTLEMQTEYNNYANNYSNNKSKLNLELDGYRFESHRVDRVTRQGSGHFPFNLYLNTLMDKIDEPGWIMFLDDDDILSSTKSIEKIAKLIINRELNDGTNLEEDNFILWQVGFPNGRLVPKRTGSSRIPRVGDLSMIGFAFHSRWKDRARFGEFKGGDHRFVKELSTKIGLSPVWIPEMLTEINYQNIRRIGSGQRNDLNFSTVQNQEYKLFWESKSTVVSMVKQKLTFRKKALIDVDRAVKSAKNQKNNPNNANNNNSISQKSKKVNSLVLDDEDSISFDKSVDYNSLDGKSDLNSQLEDIDKLLNSEKQIKCLINDGSQSDDRLDSEIDEDDDNDHENDHDENDYNDDDDDNEDDDNDDDNDDNDDDDDDNDNDDDNDDDKDSNPKKILAPKLKLRQREPIKSTKKLIVNRIVRKLNEDSENKDQNNEDAHKNKDKNNEFDNKEDKNDKNKIVNNDEDDDKNDDKKNDKKDDDNDREKNHDKNHDNNHDNNDDSDKNVDDKNEDNDYEDDNEDEDDDQDDEDDDQDNEDMVIHPQIEKLLDLLSDPKQVKVLTIKDMHNEIKKCVKDAMLETLTELNGDSVKNNASFTGIKSKPITNNVNSKNINSNNNEKNNVNKSVASRSRSSSNANKSNQVTQIPKTKMNIRERRALRMKQLKEQKLQKRAERLAKRNRLKGGRNTVSSSSNSRRQPVSRSNDEASFVENMINNKSLHTQLSELLSGDDSIRDDSMSSYDDGASEKLSNLLHSYAEEDHDENEESYDDDNLVGWDRYLDKIFILNFEGKANELQYKLESAGLTDIQIIDANKKKDFWMNMLELVRAGNKRGYKRIAIFKDNIHLSHNFVEEMMCHLPKIKSKGDWKMLAIGASQNMITKSTFDWQYYLDTYADLGRHNIKDQQAAEKHWKLNGQREHRFGQRGMAHPDNLAGLCAVVVNNKMYGDLAKLQKSRNPREFMLKNYKNYTYAVSPLVALLGLNRTVRMRNKHNLQLFDVPQF
tara:strand:- start:1740 stop:4925 length:3186 start_codon:yes stop_codon:yes gene_type:complete